MERYLSPAQIAERLGISRRHAYRLIESLPRVHIGRLVRVAESELEAYLRSQTKPPPTTESAEAPAARPSWLRPLKLRRK